MQQTEIWNLQSRLLPKFTKRAFPNHAKPVSKSSCLVSGDNRNVHPSARPCRWREKWTTSSSEIFQHLAHSVPATTNGHKASHSDAQQHQSYGTFGPGRAKSVNKWTIPKFGTFGNSQGRRSHSTASPPPTPLPLPLPPQALPVPVPRRQAPSAISRAKGVSKHESFRFLKPSGSGNAKVLAHQARPMPGFQIGQLLYQMPLKMSTLGPGLANGVKK